MGTRGLIGYRIGDKVTAQYQQYDSYPTGVGNDVLEDIRLMVQDMGLTLQNIFDIEVILNSDKICPPEVLALARTNGYLDNPNSFPEAEMTYYWAFRKNQGKLRETIYSGYIMADEQFCNDSLFCEWAYIWDLTRRELHVYSGYRKTEVSNPVKFGQLWHVGRFKDTDLPDAFLSSDFVDSPIDEA